MEEDTRKLPRGKKGPFFFVCLSVEGIYSCDQVVLFGFY
jgi:hypothetical protein